MAETRTPAEILHAEPQRFTFDAAVRLMRAVAARTAGTRKLTFDAPSSLASPTQEVVSVTLPGGARAGRLVTSVLGLTGPSGEMPRWYTELLNQVERQKSHALADFVGLLAQPALSAFADAGAKYRLPYSAEQAQSSGRAEPIGTAVLALAGYDTGTGHGLPFSADLLRHYAGFFSSYPRSASRLGAMLSDFLGRPVAVDEFVGAWLAIPPDQRTRLPHGRQAGAFCTLGVDAAIGLRSWDQQGRFILRVGPLSRRDFEALLPDRPGLVALIHLCRAYVGPDLDFAVNPELDAREIPPFRLAGGPDRETAPRLGWTTWLPSASDTLRGRKTVADALFGAWLVQAGRP
ncbi:type VI secretion system baseplate subunit TssG [Acetobacter sp. TBRC 12305]|uniref:Type VI secretion system baseplate subunit TssG n=1 Tax=Acetobacter garciniae TaxID=2817435 RepID=A0A939KP75_9PROT|nr:type VI secretion system baseplate subunit TssG [Acetobacter garciniae]MBO1326515.1 type VI secretion system baseplate subunit TssG [Acetobacter garciniae]MBX0346169.1 type VI secretion system baseplate subunit TssG [Acetobacter garciniae]